MSTKLIQCPYWRSGSAYSLEPPKAVIGTSDGRILTIDQGNTSSYTVRYSSLTGVPISGLWTGYSFIIGCSDGSIYRSTDGISWSSVRSATGYLTSSIIYDEATGYLHAFSRANTVLHNTFLWATSTDDGLTWGSDATITTASNHYGCYGAIKNRNNNEVLVVFYNSSGTSYNVYETFDITTKTGNYTYAAYVGVSQPTTGFTNSGLWQPFSSEYIYCEGSFTATQQIRAFRMTDALSRTQMYFNNVPTGNIRHGTIAQTPYNSGLTRADIFTTTGTLGTHLRRWTTDGLIFTGDNITRANTWPAANAFNVSGAWILGLINSTTTDACGVYINWDGDLVENFIKITGISAAAYLGPRIVII